MRAQYAIEAMLIAAVFFVLISLFAGLYLQISDAERSAADKSSLKRSLGLIASRADALYFLGEGSEFRVEIPANSTLSYSGGVLSLSRNGVNASRKVLANVVLAETKKNVRLVNLNGTVYIEEA